MTPHNHQNNSSTGNIRVAFFLNIGFTVVEIIGGLLTNSMAILSDALHDFGDSLSLGLAWYFQKLSSKERDKHFSFGYRRFSLLGAVINSIVLAIGSVIILMEAIPRLFNPVQPDVQGMLILAIMGVAVNLIAMLRLRKGKTLNEKTVSLHMLEDVLGWAAVLVGSLVMMFFDLPVIDPLISVLIAVYIIFNIYRNLKQSFKILLQGVPEHINVDEVKQKTLAVDKIRDVHDVHLWTMDGLYHILTMHIVLEDNLDLESIRKIKNRVKQEMEKLDIQHVTVECESKDEMCYQESC